MPAVRRAPAPRGSEAVAAVPVPDPARRGARHALPETEIRSFGEDEVEAALAAEGGLDVAGDESRLADFIAPKDSGVDDWIGAFAVTAGIGILENAAPMVQDYFPALTAATDPVARRLATEARGAVGRPPRPRPARPRAAR